MKHNPCFNIGHLKIIDHLILAVAEHEKNEADIKFSNLDFKTFAMNSWDQVIDALYDNSINAAFIPAPIAMNLFASGFEIRLLMFTHRSGSAIVKNINTDTNQISDFKNKTILVPSELSIQNMLVHRFFSSANLKFGKHNDADADVKRETVSPFLMNEMLAQDSDDDIAGFAVAEPFAIKAVLDHIAVNVCTTHSLWKNHPCCVFVVKTSLIKNNYKSVQKIISLFVQTAKKIEKYKHNDKYNDQEIFNLFQVFLDQKYKVVKTVLSQTDISFTPSLLIPDPDVLNLIQNYMANTMGVIKNKADIKKFIDSSFIKHHLAF